MTNNKLFKICKVHGELFTKDISIEKNKSSKNGFSLRCIICRREKNQRWKLKHPEKHRETSSAARTKARKEYREALLLGKPAEIPKASLWIKEDYKKNPNKYRLRAKKNYDNFSVKKTTQKICKNMSISVDEYQLLITNQGNKCAICGNEETRNNRSGSTARLCLDHNHSTGQVRELLCHACNQVIGHSKESIETLKAAIAYLIKHQKDERWSKYDNLKANFGETITFS